EPPERWRSQPWAGRILGSMTASGQEGAGRRRLDVQGLRALAIVAVVAFHGDLGLSSGFTGVDVFFVISGFVITGTLLRELERHDRIDVPRFYARRVQRLLPGLATMLTFVATVGILPAPIAAIHMSAATGVAASVFGANWYLNSLPSGYFAVTPTLDPLLHTWTLGVEEQFYLLYPAFLLAVWRLSRRPPTASPRSTANIALPGRCAGSIGAAAHWSGTSFAFYSSLTRGWELGLGCLVSLLAATWHRLPPLVCSAFGAVGITAIAAGTYGPSDAETLVLVVPVLGACCLLIAGFHPNIVSRMLSARPLTFIGDLSYSWYLWHWPLIVFARALYPES